MAHVHPNIAGRITGLVPHRRSAMLPYVSQAFRPGLTFGNGPTGLRAPLPAIRSTRSVSLPGFSSNLKRPVPGYVSWLHFLVTFWLRSASKRPSPQGKSYVSITQLCHERTAFPTYPRSDCYLRILMRLGCMFVVRLPFLGSHTVCVFAYRCRIYW
jgi:hypothetical protein